VSFIRGSVRDATLLKAVVPHRPRTIPREPPASAKRETHRDFPRARAGAGQEQIGDVRARDRQHEHRRREQHPEHVADIADVVVQQRPQRDARLRVGRRVGDGQFRRDATQIGPRARQRDVRLHASERR
jgi:hypothetical protein